MSITEERIINNERSNKIREDSFWQIIRKSILISKWNRITRSTPCKRRRILFIWISNNYPLSIGTGIEWGEWWMIYSFAHPINQSISQSIIHLISSPLCINWNKPFYYIDRQKCQSLQSTKSISFINSTRSDQKNDLGNTVEQHANIAINTNDNQ